MLFQN